MGICLGVAMEHPDDEHAQFLVVIFSKLPRFVFASMGRVALNFVIQCG